MAGVHAYTDSVTFSSLGDDQAVPFDAETFDSNGFHSLVTNTERLTFPKDGQYLMFGYIGQEGEDLRYTNLLYTGSGTCYHLHAAHAAGKGGPAGYTVWTIAQGYAGDYVRLTADIRSGGTPDTDAGQLSMAYFGTGTPACFVHCEEGELSGTSDAAITFAHEDLDPRSMHSVGTNPERITVPRAGNYLIMGHADVQAVGGNPLIALYYKINGSTLTPNGQVYGECDGAIANRRQGSIIAVPLSANDYVEMWASYPGRVNFATFGVFQIMSECCCVYVTAGQGPFANSTWTTINYGAESIDTAGFHDNSTNNSRMVAPKTGDYLIWATQLTVMASGGGIYRMRFRKNGSTVLGIDDTGTAAKEYYGGSFTHAIIQPLTAGDYVEVQGWTNAPHPSAATIYDGNAGMIEVTETFFGRDFVPQITRRR